MNNEQTAYTYSFPRVVRIEPASACNLQCLHCPTGTMKMEHGIMSMEIFRRVLRNVHEQVQFVKVIVLYHGGEPLLNANFAEMIRQIRFCCGGGAFIKTVTNGMLLSESVSQDIVAAGLDAIEISLDGQSPKENNTIRRNCSYDTVVTNIKTLIAVKKRLYLDTPRIFIAPTQFLDPKSHSGHEDPKPPGYLLKEFSGEYANEIAGFKSTWAIRWPHMEVLDEIFDLYQEPDDDEIRNTCDHVENTVTIRWNGDVVACCYDLTSQYVMGNVNTDNLATIFNNSRYLHLRKSISERKFRGMCEYCAVVKPKIFLLLKPNKHNLKGR